MDYKEASAKYRGKPWGGEVRGHAGDPEYIDPNKLMIIPGSGSSEKRRMIQPAAEALQKMKAATNNKWSFAPGQSTFRIYSEEVKICAEREAKGQVKCGTDTKAAAGMSIHGWGRAIDFQDLYSSVGGVLNKEPKEGTSAREFFNWLCNNALNYGFVNYLKECWHWEFVGVPPGKYDNPACTKSSGKYDGGSGSDEGDSEDSGSSNNSNKPSTQSDDSSSQSGTVLDMSLIWSEKPYVPSTEKALNSKASAKDPEIRTILNPDKKSLSGDKERDKQIIDIGKK